MRNASFLFTPVFDFDHAASTASEIAEASKHVGRDVGVLTFSTVICRPSEQEAYDFLDYYANQNADWTAVDNLMALQGLHAQSFTPEALAMFRDRFAAGHGGFPLVGTPEKIADDLEKLSTAGVAGTTLSFVDYAEEFPYFAENVIPILEKKGLREPFTI